VTYLWLNNVPPINVPEPFYFNKEHNIRHSANVTCHKFVILIIIIINLINLKHFIPGLALTLSDTNKLEINLSLIIEWLYSRRWRDLLGIGKQLCRKSHIGLEM